MFPRRAALGDSLMGVAAGALGPVAALTFGGLVPALVSGASAVRSRTVREYRVETAPATAS
ncbi:hypothetical protein ACFQ1B_33095 [Streptomyces mexicanus]